MAQKDSLSFDEHNKYIYYDVVVQPGLTADTFQNRMLYFLKVNYPQNKTDKISDPGSISGSGKFLILSGITAVKHVDGAISYTFHIEYKDEKYRYWLTGLVFTPYKVDRYGNSVPEEGLGVELEDGAKKLDKAELNKCLDQSAIYSIQFGHKLREYMVKVSAAPARDNKKKTIDTKNW